MLNCHRLMLRFLLILLALAGLAARTVRADSTVVFNEILYHPLEREPELEWLELHNQMAVDMDISGWFLGDGVTFSFPEGTIVPGGGYLVVAISPDSLGAAGHPGALGPFAGRLSNSGESLELFNNSGRLMDRVNYGVGGDWPVAADGSGVSLAKVRAQSPSAPAASWAPSAQVGGTPGAPNFPAGGPQVQPALAFNETHLTAAGESWIEITHRGDALARLGGLVMASHGTVTAEFVLPDVELPAGGYHVLSAADLGFELAPGNRLFLYGADRRSVLDAVRLEPDLRGRHPRGTGRWLVPESPTPGAENRFALHDEIVINEIHYHPMPAIERPAQFDFTSLLPVRSDWRFDASGAGRADPAWHEPGFDDGTWERGAALFYNESADLPAPKSTPLPLGFTSYYFRGEFEFSGAPPGVALVLRPIVDDGAVFYLNGVEILRLNMPEGEVLPDTLASRSVGNASFLEPVVVPMESLVVGSNVLAVEVHQVRVSSNDVVFGVEVALRAVRHPAQAFAESPEAWVELYNRGTATVDIGGWGFSRGIRYVFPPETRMEPGEHLVVAADRRFLESLHPGIRVLGNFEGRLSRRGELLRLDDDLGNPADEVHYYDDGRWPRYADGGGSSLELRDLRADNSRGEAWDASDERGKMGWQTFSYRGVTGRDLGPAQYHEFVLGLLEAGEVLIDDLSVVEHPDGAALELLQNGDFEEGARSWRLLGNHGHSRVIRDPADPGNRVLHLVATGPTEHMHNHAETTLAGGARILTQREYQVRFRARWLAGSSQLHTRLYFNRLPRTTVLPVPGRTGTPGARNSVYVDNAGPTFDDLSHRPVVPEPGQEVEVRIRASDPDDVAVCRLHWSVDGGPWRSRDMAPGGDGIWTRSLPGESAGSVVHLYVSGEDGRGAISRFPRGGPLSRALYRVDDGQARPGRVHQLRLVMTPADVDQLHTLTSVMSNDRMGCTVIYNESEVFYDVGVRLKGSERGRPADIRVSFNVRFQREKLFRGVHHSIHIDRSIAPRFERMIGRDEILIKHMINHAGGIPSLYDDLIRFLAPRPVHTGPAALFMARYTDVFLDSRFENGGDGSLHEYELIYYPLTTTGGPEGLKRPVPDRVIAVDLQDLGDDRETYRWNWILKNNRDRDDYSSLMRCSVAFGQDRPARDAALPGAIDVDQWLRAYALLTLSGVRDVYSLGLSHNVHLYSRPVDGRVLVFPWDMDIGFARPATAALVGDQNWGRFQRQPENLRGFYFHVRDIVESTFNDSYMARWVAHYGDLAGEDYGVILDYIRQRAAYALGQIPGPAPFAVTTNGGEDFAVEGEAVAIAGTAGIEVATVLLVRQGKPVEPVLSYPDVTTWRASVPLEPGENALTFVAVGRQGETLGSDPITVTRTDRGNEFIRGDCSDDGGLTISDPICILNWLFLGGRAPVCLAALNADGEGTANITDATFLLGFLFLGGPPPPAPFPGCGPAGENDRDLACEAAASSCP